MKVRVDMIVDVADEMSLSDIEYAISDNLMEYADIDVYEFIDIEEI